MILLTLKFSQQNSAQLVKINHSTSTLMFGINYHYTLQCLQQWHYGYSEGTIKKTNPLKKGPALREGIKKKMAIVMWNVWRGGAFPNVSLSGNAFITSIVIYRGEFCHSESGCLRHWCLSLPTACSTLGDKNGFLSVYQAKAWVGSHFLSLLFFCGSQHILVTGQISLQDLCWLWAYCNCNQYNIFICCWIIYKRKFLFLIKLGCFGLLCKLE